MEELNTHVAIYNTRPTIAYYHVKSAVPNEKLLLFISDANNILPVAESSGLNNVLTRLKRRLSFQMERIALNRASLVVTNSQYLTRQIEDVYGVPAENIRLLYKAVDLESFTKKMVTELSSPVRILFAKSDYQTGGLIDLLNALKHVEFEYHLTVIGPKKKQHSRIRGFCTPEQIDRLSLPGRVAREEMPTIFRDHDLFCVPSLREALGVVFLEALASGLPAIGSHVGGIPEVLEGGQSGWLTPPEDPVKLSEVLTTAVNNSAERNQRVLNGLEHVKKFSLEHMAARFMAIVKELETQQI